MAEDYCPRCESKIIEYVQMDEEREYYICLECKTEWSEKKDG